MMFPLVRDLAAEGIPVRLTCGVLGFSHPGVLQVAGPTRARDRDLDDAHLTNALVDLHADDPEFGYRFLADELEARRPRSRRAAGVAAVPPAAALVDHDEEGPQAAARRPGPPVHDDLVQRNFTATRPDAVWLTDITEHPTLEFQPSSQHCMKGAVLSDTSRVQFFQIMDRGSTIRAAAIEVGVSPDVGYKWMRKAGVSALRQRPRVYTDEEKAEFFRLLAEVGNVSAVARELGFVRVTCYKWAHQAGIFTSKNVDAEREQFRRLRDAGVSRSAAAAEVGIDKRSAHDWDKGIRQFYGGRIYPDGHREVLASRNDREGEEATGDLPHQR